MTAVPSGLRSRIKAYLQDLAQDDNVQVGSLATERIGNGQFPDVVVFRDGTDAVAVDTSDGALIQRSDATTDGIETIQAAHDALPAAGGHIYITSGRYSTNDAPWNPPQLLITKDNVTMSGDGDSTVLTVEDGATETNRGHKFIHVGGEDNTTNYNGTNQYDGFTIRDLKIDGNQQNQGTIDNQYDGHNIQIQGADFKVVNVTSINSTGDGVEPASRTTDANGIPQTQRGVIADCIFKDCWEQCIHLHGVAHVTVTGNVCDGEVNNDVLHLYTHQTDNHDIVIANNTFVNGAAHGVTLDSGQTDGSQKAYNIWFVNNHVAYNGGLGIDVDGRDSYNIYVVGNHIYENGSHGIQVKPGDRVLIKENVIRHNQLNGIKLNNDPGAVQDVWIDGNRIYDNNRADGFNHGIELHSQAANAFDNIVIKNNNFALRDTTVIQDNAIYFREQTAGTYSDIAVRDNYAGDDYGGATYNYSDFSPAYHRGNVPTEPIDVRQLKAEAGNQSYHDGTNTNTVGPAFYDGGAAAWTSLVDGTTIS